MRPAWISGALASVVLAAPWACKLGDVGLTMAIADGPIAADGRTAHPVTVCNTSDEPAAKVSVTLVASTGAWEHAASDEKDSLTFELGDGPETRCRTEPWIPPRDLGSVRFDAKVGSDVLDTLDRDLVMAAVTGLALRVTPNVLPGDAGITLKVGVDIATGGNGLPTNGTRVDVRVDGSDPVGIAAVADGPIIVGTRDSLDLVVASGARSIKLAAALDGADPPATTCRVVTALGSAPTLEACP